VDRGAVWSGSITPRLPWLDLGTFNVCAWQAYFIVGQYLGFRRR
jgi:hypothetical protein